MLSQPQRPRSPNAIRNWPNELRISVALAKVDRAKVGTETDFCRGLSRIIFENRSTWIHVFLHGTVSTAGALVVER